MATLIADFDYKLMHSGKHNTGWVPTIVFYAGDRKDCIIEPGKLFEIAHCECVSLSTWHEVVTQLELGVEYLTIHISTVEQSTSSVHEFVNMIVSLTKFMPASANIKIGVVIDKATNIKIINELKKTHITGILLNINEFPEDQVVAALDAFIMGVRYWPKHILSFLPGNVLKPTVNGVLKLTERQKEVMALVCNRGLSNKQIAKALNITESTVKIHVSAIMKVYAVRNRTQLALAAGNSLKA